MILLCCSSLPRNTNYRLELAFHPEEKKNNLYLLNYKTTMSLRDNALISLGYKIFIMKIYYTLNKC